MNHGVVVLDVGGTAIKAAVCLADGSLRCETVFAVAAHRGSKQMVPAVLGAVASMIDAGVRSLGTSPDGVSLAVPGIVDASRGVGISSLILGWRDVPFARLVTTEHHLPTTVGHDVRLAAQAERVYGAGRESDDFLFVTLGTGVGSVMYLHGKPYFGADGLAGEIAHLVVSPTGPRCRCGKVGCLEMLASADAVTRDYRSQSGDGSASARDVVERLGSDLVAERVWATAVESLALGLSTYSELMAPAQILLGGGMAQAGSALLDPLRRRLPTMLSHDRVPAVDSARLSTKAGLYGAALHFWERQGADAPTSLPGLVGPEPDAISSTASLLSIPIQAGEENVRFA